MSDCKGCSSCPCEIEKVSVLTRLSLAGLLTQSKLAEWLRYRTGISVQGWLHAKTERFKMNDA